MLSPISPLMPYTSIHALKCSSSVTFYDWDYYTISMLANPFEKKDTRLLLIPLPGTLFPRKRDMCLSVSFCLRSPSSYNILYIQWLIESPLHERTCTGNLAAASVGYKATPTKKRANDQLLQSRAKSSIPNPQA